MQGHGSVWPPSSRECIRHTQPARGNPWFQCHVSGSPRQWFILREGRGNGSRYPSVRFKWETADRRKRGPPFPLSAASSQLVQRPGLSVHFDGTAFRSSEPSLLSYTACSGVVLMLIRHQPCSTVIRCTIAPRPWEGIHEKLTSISYDFPERVKPDPGRQTPCGRQPHQAFSSPFTREAIPPFPPSLAAEGLMMQMAASLRGRI